MIPDFKTYLKESLWADVQSQASGDTVKKEDDVNSMDKDRFFEYLQDHYEYHMSSIQNTEKHGIFIPVCNPDPAYAGSLSLELHYIDSPTIPEIRMDVMPLWKAPKFEGIIRKEYNVVDVTKKTWLEEGYMIINPKDGSKASNSFCLSVIDFLLDTAKKEKRFRNLKKK